MYPQTPRKCIFILGTSENDQKCFQRKNLKKINSAALFLQNLVISDQDQGKVYSFSIYCQINSASKFKFWEPSSPVPPFSSPLMLGTRVSGSLDRSPIISSYDLGQINLNGSTNIISILVDLLLTGQGQLMRSGRQTSKNSPSPPCWRQRCHHSFFVAGTSVSTSRIVGGPYVGTLG